MSVTTQHANELKAACQRECKLQQQLTAERKRGGELSKELAQVQDCQQLQQRQREHELQHLLVSVTNQHETELQQHTYKLEQQLATIKQREQNLSKELQQANDREEMLNMMVYGEGGLEQWRHELKTQMLAAKRAPCHGRFGDQAEVR